MILALGNRGNTPVWSEGDFQNMWRGAEQRRGGEGKARRNFSYVLKKKKF